MKTAVYFCSCGDNITERIAFEQLKKDLSPHAEIAYVKPADFLCAAEGKEFLKNDLLGERPDRVVIPKIVGFLCNWCSYAGADKAGAAQIPYPANFKPIRAMCSGRVDPQFVLQAYEKGADGVMILACHPGDCHYKEGNYRATQRHRMLLRLLEQFGIEPERCRFNYVSAGEGEKFVNMVKEMVDTVRSLGPLWHNAN